MKKPGKRHQTIKENHVAPTLVPTPNAVDPTKDVTVIEPPPSPALKAARDEAGMLVEIFSMLGQATIRALQAPRAKEILDYMQVKVDEAEARVLALLPKEAPEKLAEQLSTAAVEGAVDAIQGKAN